MNRAGILTERQLEAVLCGVMRVVGKDVFLKVDWAEVGVSNWAANQWWRRHQADDAARIEAERATPGAGEKKG